MIAIRKQKIRDNEQILTTFMNSEILHKIFAGKRVELLLLRANQAPLFSPCNATLVPENSEDAAGTSRYFRKIFRLSGNARLARNWRGWERTITERHAITPCKT